MPPHFGPAIPRGGLGFVVSDSLEGLRGGTHVRLLMLKPVQTGHPVPGVWCVDVSNTRWEINTTRQLRQQDVPRPEIPRGHVHLNPLEELVPVLHERDDLRLVELVAVRTDNGIAAL